MRHLGVVAGYQLRAAAAEPLGIFFTILLPLLLFVFFGFVFGLGEGRSAEYALFVLPGMIGVMCSSDALYMVGPTIRSYLAQGLVREFKGLPLWTGHLFLGFTATRLIFVLVSMACLLVASRFLFGYMPDGLVVARILFGAAVTFVAYALLAVAVSIYANSSMGDYGFGSVYYFLGMFLCDAFFVLFEEGSVPYMLSFVFPLRPALLFMRGEDWPLLMLAAWMLAAMALVVFALRRRLAAVQGRKT